MVAELNLRNPAVTISHGAWSVHSEVCASRSMFQKYCEIVLLSPNHCHIMIAIRHHFDEVFRSLRLGTAVVCPHSGGTPMSRSYLI